MLVDYKKRKRLALVIIFSAQKAGNKNGAFIGLGVFVAACVATAIIDPGSSGKAKSGGKIANKYDPLLLDERTKQHPDVQRLLQYTSVQRTFFDPSYLGTKEAQNDPNVQELLEVFDQMLANGVPFPSASAKELLPSEPAKMKKKPRKVVGAVLAYIGVLLIIAPFALMFIFTLTEPEDGAVGLS